MIDYKINIIPFKMLRDKVVVSFSLTEKEGFSRVFKNNLPIEFPDEQKRAIERFAWWSITPEEGTVDIAVNLLKNKRFAKYYYNKILYTYFTKLEFPINRNFLNDTEVYIEEKSYINDYAKKFNRFSLKIIETSLLNNLGLLLTYEGASFVLKNSFEDSGLDEDRLNRILYNGRVTKYKFLDEREKLDKQNIFPVLNLGIKKALGITPDRNFSENKYKKYYDLITLFYDKYLNNIEIEKTIQIFSSGFYKPHFSEISHTSDDSNLLLFGNNNKNYIPYMGIKNFGPIKKPSSDKNIKFIFIFHEQDKEFANKLYSYLKRGYKSFPGLEPFVGINFEIDEEKTIRFTNPDPIPEITKALENYEFDNGNTYAAIYISQIKKGTEDEEKDKIYYQIKEILLRYEITSQVIYRDNITNPAFNYYLPNIAIALLAKLGGIPWRLYRPIQNDLVVGIGAEINSDKKGQFIGSAFCFRNDGIFKGFNVFEKENTEALAISIKNAIKQYVSEHTNFDRLVIHYYKVMSRKEEEPIQEILNQLNLNVPCVIITVNETESKDLVLFDTSFDGKMPQSGTFIKIRWNEFLLCNNIRYSQKTMTKIDSYPFPIKIKIRSNDSNINDIKVVKELIDQVYQFSRMYWKSVRQRNMPVTIEYSKLISESVANFESKDLVPFAKNSLWFL